LRKAGFGFAKSPSSVILKETDFLYLTRIRELENALLDKEETTTINDMILNFQEEIRSFIRSLPNVELKHDPMSEEAYFYGLRNFAHFHGPRHIDIRLSKPQQEDALKTHIALHHHKQDGFHVL